MKTNLRFILIPAMILLLAGCGNKLVYFENTAFKLGISVGQDPSRPVSVTTGLDRRLVAVVPPKKLTNARTMFADDPPTPSGRRKAADEAVSVASRFSLEYRMVDENGNPSNEHCRVKLGDDRLGLLNDCSLELDTAFVTGKAAKKYTARIGDQPGTPKIAERR